MLLSFFSSLSTAEGAVCTQDAFIKYVLVVTFIGRQNSEGAQRVTKGCKGWRETLGAARKWHRDSVM